jgi:hypothetical protein
MIGYELGLFTEKKEIAHSIGEFKKYSDEELVQILEHEARALLEDHKRRDLLQLLPPQPKAVAT